MLVRPCSQLRESHLPVQVRALADQVLDPGDHGENALALERDVPDHLAVAVAIKNDSQLAFLRVKRR